MIKLLLCLVIGYLLGSFSMGILVANKEGHGLIKSAFQLMKPHKAPFEPCFLALC